MYTQTIATALCLFGAVATAAPAVFANQESKLTTRSPPTTVWTYTDSPCGDQNQVYYGDPTIACTGITDVYSFHGGTSGQTCSLTHYSGSNCQGSSTTETIDSDCKP